MKIRAILFFLSMPLFCFCSYYSQINQDEIANTRYFKNKKDGVFVEVGAHNGITLSNSYFFEKELGWKGLCVEPIPEVFEQLQKNRSCYCIQGCVTDFTGPGDFLRVKCPEVEMLSGLLSKLDPRHFARVKTEIAQNSGSIEIMKVNCYFLNDLLDKFGFSHIDFLSLDTEGGEFEIISSIDYSKYTIDVITLEDNYGDERFVPFLESKGYHFVERNRWDLLFVRKEFLEKLQ